MKLTTIYIIGIVILLTVLLLIFYNIYNPSQQGQKNIVPIPLPPSGDGDTGVKGVTCSGSKCLPTQSITYWYINSIQINGMLVLTDPSDMNNINDWALIPSISTYPVLKGFINSNYQMHQIYPYSSEGIFINTTTIRWSTVDLWTTIQPVIIPALIDSNVYKLLITGTWYKTNQSLLQNYTTLNFSDSSSESAGATDMSRHIITVTSRGANNGIVAYYISYQDLIITSQNLLNTGKISPDFKLITWQDGSVWFKI